MTARPFGLRILRILLSLTFLVLLLMLLSPEAVVKQVLVFEVSKYQSHCPKADVCLANIGNWFMQQRLALARLQSFDNELSQTPEETQEQIRTCISSFLDNRLAAASLLTSLFCVRITAYAFSLLLILLFLAAASIDAVCERRIAHQTFKTSRPAVSLLSAASFFTAFCLGLVLLIVPVTGAATAGTTVLAASALGLYCWIRYFHIL